MMAYIWITESLAAGPGTGTAAGHAGTGSGEMYPHLPQTQYDEFPVIAAYIVSRGGCTAQVVLLFQLFFCQLSD